MQSRIASTWSPTMPRTTPLAGAAIEAALNDLGDAARLGLKTPHVTACICTAVANIIASAQHGSTHQKNIMDDATNAGFTPEYWAAGVRVSFSGSGKANPSPGLSGK